MIKLEYPCYVYRFPKSRICSHSVHVVHGTFNCWLKCICLLPCLFKFTSLHDILLRSCQLPFHSQRRWLEVWNPFVCSVSSILFIMPMTFFCVHCFCLCRCHRFSLSIWVRIPESSHLNLPNSATLLQWAQLLYRSILRWPRCQRKQQCDAAWL